MPVAADSPQTGTVEGTVNDAGGGPLPGVTVTLAGDRGAQTVVTGEDGAFRFGLLAPGDYTVGASLEGFRGAEQAVHVDSGGRSAITLTLGLESSEAITVTSEAPLVSKFEVATVATLESEVAEDLSFNSRNYQSVTYMMPGVVQSSNSQSLGDHRPGINGGTWQENAAFVDGVDTSNTRRGGSSRIFLPTTALSEVRMDGSGYGAEYGRVTGGVTGVIIKSGTNQFHGDFLYIAQNQDWRVAVGRGADRSRRRHHRQLRGCPRRPDLPRQGVVLRRGGRQHHQRDRPPARRHRGRRQPRTRSRSWARSTSSPARATRSRLTYVDAPAEKPLTNPNFGDIFTLPLFKLGGDFTTASWNFSAADDKFLELRGATQSSTEDRVQTAFRDARPDQEHPHAAQQPRQMAGPGAPPSSGTRSGRRWVLATSISRAIRPTRPSPGS